jgi:HK97 gp10 family phage protein
VVTKTRVEVKGLRQLGEAMRALSADMAGRVARSATAAGAGLVKKRAVAIVVANPSIDTGALKGAIIVKRRPAKETRLSSEHLVTVRGRGKPTTKKGRVINRAPHASKVEFGTVHMAPEPFLRPAFEQEKNNAMLKIRDTLKRRIDKAGKAGAK